MTKFERVMKVINGEKTDYIPSGFWLHFPKETLESIEKTLDAHMDFLKKTDIDLFKVMNENEFRRSEKIVSANDWKNLSVYTKNHKKLINQREILKRIVDKIQGKTVILATVHGIVASLSHMSGISYNTSYKLMNEHFFYNKKEISYALDVAKESIINMIDISIKNSDGIYYAALGGENTKFTNEIFEEFIKPREIEIFKYLKSKGKINVLHVCKENVELKRYIDYDFDCLNFGIHDGFYSLEQAYDLFKGKTIIGGFDDRTGILVDGDKNEIIEYTNKLINNMKKHKFIIGADCTLPTEISYDRIKEVVNASKSFKSYKK